MSDIDQRRNPLNTCGVICLTMRSLSGACPELVGKIG